MRFLFTTLQDLETEFYGRVGRELEQLGHEVAHVTWSAPDAVALRAKGHRTWCLPEAMDALPEDTDVAAEVARIERQYETPTIRDIYKTDWPCYGQSEEWCLGGPSVTSWRSRRSSTSGGPRSWCPRWAARRCAPRPI